MKKNTAILIAATGNLAFAVANILVALQRHSPRFADNVILYYDHFSHIDLERLETLEPSLLVRPYTMEMLQQRLGIDASQAHLDENFSRLTHLTYARYEIFDLLQEYHNVIYLDTDILIQGDISGMTAYGPLGLVRDTDSVAHQFVDGAFSRILLDDFGVLPDMTRLTRNCGVIVARDDLEQHETITSELYQLTWKYLAEQRYRDQAILNLYTLAHKIDTADLPSRYHHLIYFPSDMTDKPSVVHFAGQNKIWNHAILQQVFPEWMENNSEWETLGGSPYKGQIRFQGYIPKQASEYLRQFDYLEYWQKLYESILDDIPDIVRPHWDFTRNPYSFFLKNLDHSISYGFARAGHVLVLLCYRGKTHITEMRELFATFPAEINGLPFMVEENAMGLIYRTQATLDSKSAIAATLRELVQHTHAPLYTAFKKMPPPFA